MHPDPGNRRQACTLESLYALAPSNSPPLIMELLRPSRPVLRPRRSPRSACGEQQGEWMRGNTERARGTCDGEGGMNGRRMGMCAARACLWRHVACQRVGVASDGADDDAAGLAGGVVGGRLLQVVQQQVDQQEVAQVVGAAA